MKRYIRPSARVRGDVFHVFSRNHVFFIITRVVNKKPIMFYEPCRQLGEEILHVVAVVSNPAEFNRRYELFQQFCERMRKNPRVNLLTVELQQGCRPFVTDATVKLKSSHELWHKENLINIGVQHLPDNFKYVAWIDSDIDFQNPTWAEETMSLLQTYSIVQLFSHAIDLGPKGETLQVHTGFGYQYVNGVQWRLPKYGQHFHPGYAFACTRTAYNAMGGLMDFSILGSADNHMALAWIGEVQKSLPKKIHPNYRKLCMVFQQRCEAHIRRNIGYVPGTILHFWHGDKGDRQYATRWQILESNNFDPLVDIKKDCDNLWQLETNKFKLRDDIRRYFRQRNEDNVHRLQAYPFTKAQWL
jgi:hypothetical protein